jgi:hypothetical protein
MLWIAKFSDLAGELHSLGYKSIDLLQVFSDKTDRLRCRLDRCSCLIFFSLELGDLA